MSAILLTPEVRHSPPPAIRLADDRMSQREAAKKIGIGFTSVSRYMTKGRLGVKLPSLPVGGKRQTTQAAIDWFFEQIQARDAVQDSNRNLSRQQSAAAPSEADIEAAADAAGL